MTITVYYWETSPSYETYVRSNYNESIHHITISQYSDDNMTVLYRKILIPLHRILRLEAKLQ